MKKLILVLTFAVAAFSQAPVARQGQLVTAGTGGVTVNLLAAKDTSNPTVYVLPPSGGCGVGIADATVTATNTFHIQNVSGSILTGVADGTITAGHYLTGGTSTVGRVADTGVTGIASVPQSTCVVGFALASATVGQTVSLLYEGPGLYGGALTATGIAGAVYGTGGGTAQAQTVTLTTAITSLTAGLQVCWLPSNANTGAAPTVAVSGLTATAITKLGATAVVANDLKTTAVACAIYDGTQFELQNPQTTAAGGAAATYWNVSSGDPSASGGTSTNVTAMWSIYIPYSLSVGTIVADLQTAVIDTCDIGIYDSGGTLQAHWGATSIGSGVTFQSHAISGGTKSFSAGFYEVGWTCTSTSTIFVSAADQSVQFVGGSNPTSGSATSGGALNSSVGVPTTTASNLYRIPIMFLRP